MRATWHNLRKKAASEIDTFKQLLFVESDEEGRATDTEKTNMRIQWTEETKKVDEIHGQTPQTFPFIPVKEESLEPSEQRLRMINSVGEGISGASTANLDDFTNQLISRYTESPQQPSGIVGKGIASAASVYNKICKQVSLGNQSASQTNDAGIDLSNDADPSSSIVVSSRLYILYKLCCNLESLWKDIEDRVSDATGFSMEIQALPRSQLWQDCKSVHNDHAEKILCWIERSFHNMGVLAHVLGIEDAKIFSSSGLLADCLNAALTGAQRGMLIKSGANEEIPGEYMRLIMFITKLQTDYDRRLQKLQTAHDSALVKANKTIELEKKVETLNERVKALEEELRAKEKEVLHLTESLNSANSVKTQLVQKNEELIASNQRLLMTKSEFIDKDAVRKMIQQYYNQDRSGSSRRDDIIKLLESMLGIEPPAQDAEHSTETNARTLANQFIDFLEEKTEG